jgi:light-regulated signal transduction histidine kinase (bacteriophytochrome)
MSKMIDDLLSLSRVTSKAEAFKQVDLNTVIHAVLEDLQTRIESSQAQVTISPLPAVQADTSQMHQLFLNLIGNAIKFRKQEVPPVVKVGCSTSNGTITITVSDNGIGFDMKHAGKLFQPFQRLHSRSEYEGNGIGLSICKKIVERHGGSISVQSEPELGTTFTITLPIHKNSI